MLLFVAGKKAIYCMNDVHVLTVLCAATVDRVPCSFFGWELVETLVNFSFLFICNRQIVCSSYFGV